MPKKLIKRILPHPGLITENRFIKKLGPVLQAPDIWHINRRSVSGAVALGLFCAFIPIPIQMWIAAFGAILFSVNILISVPMVWLTNPVTIPPMFYFCYLVGNWILAPPPGEFHFELSFHWLSNELLQVWKPFLLGCFVVGTVSAITGFSLVRLLWRYHIIKQLRNRKLRTENAN